MGSKSIFKNSEIDYTLKKIKDTNYWTTYDHSIGNRT